jgi:hypothetical protein
MPKSPAFRQLKLLYKGEKGYTNLSRPYCKRWTVIHLTRFHYWWWNGINPRPVHILTAGGGKEYTLHVHTARVVGKEMKEYTLDVHTAGGGK